MKTKNITGIEYIVYEAGMILNDETKSYYFEGDVDYDGDVKCLHFYAVKDAVVGGNQYVRFVYLHLYCRWPIRLDRDSHNIKIGCVEKSEREWDTFFAEKQKIESDPDSKQYKLIENAFKAAKVMRVSLAIMTEKQTEDVTN